MAAVPSEFVSKVVGYQLTAGDFSETTPNLPQRVLIVAEANEANQGTMPTGLTQITSDKQAGELYGYGSPIESMARIFYPNSGSGIGGIPVFVAVQDEPAGAAVFSTDISVTGTATGNATHKLIINGRNIIDGERYDVNILKDDTAIIIADKIRDAVNGVLRSPLEGSTTGGSDVSLKSKWAGLTANDITVEIDDQSNAAGISYSAAITSAGAGSPTVTSALNLMGNEWFTIVCSGYGMNTDIIDELEAFNGKPDPNNPTGRYSGIVFKPFIGLCGSTADNESALTDLRKTEVTLAVCSAPLSKGMQYEAAANYAVLYARQAQERPEADISGYYLPDMPVPEDCNIGTMKDYINRDLYVKKGCTTVECVSDQYKIADFVTTYHPDGEAVPSYRYVRSLTQDFNIKFGLSLLEEQYVVDNVIAEDDQPVRVDGVIKPKSWKGILYTYADDLSLKAIITEPSFMKDSIQVQISTSNPERLDTFFRYKRSGYARISSTVAEAGFNFGEL
jgi:phage tail sheath gpL-like